MFNASSHSFGSSLVKSEDWTQERARLGAYYQSQGFCADGSMTNDCGPASLATAANLLSAGLSLGMQTAQIIQEARYKAWERLPRWVPNVGGATSPWGLVNSFNAIANREGWEWRAERASHADLTTILHQLLQGIPVTALKIWKNGGAHWVNIVRISSDKSKVYFLDPNPYLENLSPDKRLQTQTWLDFYSDWNRSVWWSRLLRIAREVITYYRV